MLITSTVSYNDILTIPEQSEPKWQRPRQCGDQCRTGLWLISLWVSTNQLQHNPLPMSNFNHVTFDNLFIRICWSLCATVYESKPLYKTTICLNTGFNIKMGIRLTIIKYIHWAQISLATAVEKSPSLNRLIKWNVFLLMIFQV